MKWQLRNRTLDLGARGVVMGVLNVTPDSFSDGGAFLDLERAVARALAMVAEGAEIIDIGGESTRPGAEPVCAEEEMRRVLPVIERLAPHGVLLSIDTMKPIVARAALDAGAAIVNDVGGLRDPAMREVVRATGAGAIVMHMQGTPRDMQRAPAYEDVVQEVRQFFRQQEAACLTSGVAPHCLAFDPGLGFGKTVAHNRALLRSLGELAPAQRPVVLGVSRKSFLGEAIGSRAMEDRAWPTVALTSLARTLGARVVRVHDVRPNVEAMRMTEAILGGGA
ncbi:MAG TPA: dihydropteroate synthase [Chthoniobacteraceae bacterium]|jgi:dihydropteroate synthase|nr:dihydropteroate synthase [Chthoniobacteraceae bacterium]